MASDKDILTEGKETYKLHIDAERENRDRYLEDYRFARMGEQWDADIKAQRDLDGKPSLTINRLPAFGRQVVNDARQNKPRIKTKPVDSFGDPKTALAFDGVILNIENQSNAGAAYDTGIESAVYGGYGYWRIDIDYTDRQSFDKDIKITRITNPLNVVGDAYSESVDSSDWNTAFITSLMNKDRFQKLYKGAAKSDWFDIEYGSLKDNWVDGDDVLIAEWWKREEVDKNLLMLSDGRTMYEDVYINQAAMLMAYGIQPINSRKTKGYKVTQYVMTGAEVLDTRDWAGCYIPIVPVYGEELNIEGKRHFLSLIHAAKDPQRRLNYWTSAATEIVALAPKTPYIGQEKAFALEPAKWATVNRQTHAYIAVPAGVEIPQRQPLDGGQAVGAISQALTAADDIKAVLGMYDASLGQRSNETSGKAIMARQREGDTSTFHFIDNLNRAIQHTGRILVDLIPYVYTPGRIVRILGEDGKATTAKVQNRMPGDPPPQRGPFEAEQPTDEMQEGMSAEGYELIYDFGTGKYDVTVDTGPSYTTQREETVAALTELIRSVPNAAPLVADKLMKALNVADAEEISERFKAMIPQQAQGGLPPQLMQAMDKLKQDAIQFKQELDALKADKTLDERKLDNEAYKIETERMKELLPYMPPETLAELGLQMNVQAMNTPDPAPGEPTDGPQYNA